MTTTAGAISAVSAKQRHAHLVGAADNLLRIAHIRRQLVTERGVAPVPLPRAGATERPGTGTGTGQAENNAC